MTSTCLLLHGSKKIHHYTDDIDVFLSAFQAHNYDKFQSLQEVLDPQPIVPLLTDRLRDVCATLDDANHNDYVTQSQDTILDHIQDEVQGSMEESFVQWLLILKGKTAHQLKTSEILPPMHP